MTEITPPTPNIPLLRKAVEWAEAEAAKTDGTCLWNQEWWASQVDCGTAFCIAGYIVETQHDSKLLSPQGGGEYWCVEIDGAQGGPPLWEDTARADLGLTGHEASRLFDASNTIEDVRRYAERIAARAGERL